jgi:hypothetical protein
VIDPKALSDDSIAVDVKKIYLAVR